MQTQTMVVGPTLQISDRRYTRPVMKRVRGTPRWHDLLAAWRLMLHPTRGFMELPVHQVAGPP